MNSEEVAFWKDRILKHIVESGKSLNVTEISIKINLDFDAVFVLTSELSELKLISFIDATSRSGIEKIVTIRPEGRFFFENNSFLATYKEDIIEKRKAKNKLRREWLVQIISILVALIGVLWGIYKDVQSDRKDQQIRMLEKKIKILNK
ncbi:hypothetical protein LRS06_13195 [Hymenobacter sp. J193]|uniref:hypothetical protein n=1 Tax=Hymenobacter sp. J193 TaxID=2898429 RepID=UPI0021513487|nr:hypothetical protein [Hymenobacter sp. J193]MCR5888706.1 hypothetical protein [Hymenobacter sp. J193]